MGVNKFLYYLGILNADLTKLSQPIYRTVDCTTLRKYLHILVCCQMSHVFCHDLQLSIAHDFVFTKMTIMQGYLYFLRNKVCMTSCLFVVFIIQEFVTFHTQTEVA